MQLALVLAAEGEGLTRPNPPVGAVVVKNNRLIGEGFHPKAGQPHAEVFALNAAGHLARGATLYVTLEPCCTTGRTAPCTEAIIRSGISRVVYGCVDPNPLHAGRADKILRKAGIKVTRNVLQDACETMMRPFATRMVLHRPYVTLKLACSLDGKIADARGTSKWITGPQAREAVQDLRRSADAIMIGAETLRLDNPSLLPRPAYGRTPLRVIIAGKKPLPMNANIFSGKSAKQTIVFADKHFRQKVALEKLGVQVVITPSAHGRASLPSVLRELAARDCMHVVCEGGGHLARSLLRNDVVDQCWIFYAPLILGGDARPSVAGKGWELSNTPRFNTRHCVQLGHDVLITARRA